jgi:hypothetical protein
MTSLLKPLAITTALAGYSAGPLVLDGAPRNLTLEAELVYGGAGGTSVDAYVQTSLDGGASWIDIAEFHFTTSSANAVFNLNAQTPVTTQYTPTSGSLTANTAKDGILGPRFQILVNSTGTYGAGTMLAVYAASIDLPAIP